MKCEFGLVLLQVFVNILKFLEVFLILFIRGQNCLFSYSKLDLIIYYGMVSNIHRKNNLPVIFDFKKTYFLVIRNSKKVLTISY